MSTQEKTGAPPLYPSTVSYQQFQHGPPPPSSVPPPPPGNGDAVMAEEVHHHDSSDRKGQLEELGEVDPASIIPGKGPGGAPQQYFNLEFEDCFEEHHKTKTFPALYKVLGLVYKYTKLILYHIFVIVVGIPLMFHWAIINGIMTFVLIWVWGPFLRLTVTVVYSVAPVWYVPVQAILSPIVDVLARIFRQCVVKAKFSGGIATSNREHIV